MKLCKSCNKPENDISHFSAEEYRSIPQHVFRDRDWYTPEAVEALSNNMKPSIWDILRKLRLGLAE